MKQLFEIDLHDYEESFDIFSRPSARAVITDGSRIALVYSIRDRYYKFPGGGIKNDEDRITALIREVREETGLIVKPESIREFGSVMRRQKSNMRENTIFVQENFYYFCECENLNVGQELDEYEADAQFTLVYADINEAIAVNRDFCGDDFDEIMIERERRVLELIRDMM